MQLVDTHSHIHDSKYGFDTKLVLANADNAGVSKIICVGTDAEDSAQAVRFVQDKPACVATIGLHPHEANPAAAGGQPQYHKLEKLVSQPKVVAIGECGLDYFYQHSPKTDQIKALRWQIELALQHQKPLVFHVREAFEDFFKIIDKYKDVSGVVHSFSSGVDNLEQILKRGLYVALNGIMTFTKDERQLTAARAVPLEQMLLETDSPFLTPTPLRGKVNEPANVKLVAEFLAGLRGDDLEEMTKVTTRNAKQLFDLT